MKKLLIGLLCVATSAHAERWFEMKNNAGGKIILTEYKCDNNDKGRLVIANANEGDTVTGCWFYFTGMIHIVWEGGKKSSFDPKDFVMKEAK